MSSKPNTMNYERDPRWTAIDNYTQEHLFTNTDLNAALENALQSSLAAGLPDISVSASQGKFLQIQCTLINAKNILEFGTLGGYSTIFLAASNPGAKVVSVEVNAKHADVARENVRAAGYAEQVDIIVGAGVDVLPRLSEEVQAGKRAKFDFVFIDADKANNWFYFDTSVGMCRPRAQIIVDNVVRKGSTADEVAARTDANVQGARRVIENVGKDPRVDGVVLQTVGDKSYDGFLITVVKDSV